MNVLFEGYSYTSTLLDGILPEAYIRQLPGGEAQVLHIGYIGPLPGIPESKAVVILPKVFLTKDDKALGGHAPEELIGLSAKPKLREQLRQSGSLEFLFTVSVWLYQAINYFARRNAKSDLIQESELHSVTNSGKAGHSALELVQSLLRFHREQQSLLTFVKRYNTNQQRNVSWSRTVTRQTPLLNNGQPVYTQTITKQQYANYDEELLRIFVSTLIHFKSEYGFRFEVNSLYEPLSKSEFKRFQQSPTRRLKQIRSRYFNDQLVRLWNLLFIYYEHAERQRSQSSRQEKTLVRNFDIVFEDMVDSLLSDPISSRLPERFKTQKDGKIVDHLYEADALIGSNDTIYHIGDSKYYKTGAKVGQHSIYKQHTYARNLIFENISRLNKGTLPRPLRYRDNLTEGYNPTPNFFISAQIDTKLNFSNHNLTFNRPFPTSYHFPDRLFDRDTLFLQQYDINFLYVLAAYVTPKAGELSRFRATAHNAFRTRLIAHLNSQYVFFRAQPHTKSLEEFVSQYFRQLVGKMYRPSDFTDEVLIAVPRTEGSTHETALILLLAGDVILTSWTLE